MMAGRRTMKERVDRAGVHARHLVTAAASPATTTRSVTVSMQLRPTADVYRNTPLRLSLSVFFGGRANL